MISGFSNFWQRIISALILVPMVLLLIYIGGYSYLLFLILMTSVGLYEWMKLFKNPKRKIMPALGWLLAGLIYLGGCGLALLYLRARPHDGMMITFYVFFLVWGTDTGGYVCGKLIGGAKLAPKISPNKTWAGFMGGIIFAMLFGYAVMLGAGQKPPLGMLGLTAILSVASQCGDLFKSYFKRRAGVKDTGNIIPGHGGVLDRIDGLIFASILLASIMLIISEI